MLAGCAPSGESSKTLRPPLQRCRRFAEASSRPRSHQRRQRNEGIRRGRNWRGRRRRAMRAGRRRRGREAVALIQKESQAVSQGNTCDSLRGFHERCWQGGCDVVAHRTVRMAFAPRSTSCRQTIPAKLCIGCGIRRPKPAAKSSTPPKNGRATSRLSTSSLFLISHLISARNL